MQTSRLVETPNMITPIGQSLSIIGKSANHRENTKAYDTMQNYTHNPFRSAWQTLTGWDIGSILLLSISWFETGRLIEIMQNYRFLLNVYIYHSHCTKVTEECTIARHFFMYWPQKLQVIGALGHFFIHYIYTVVYQHVFHLQQIVVIETQDKTVYRGGCFS